MEFLQTTQPSASQNRPIASARARSGPVDELMRENQQLQHELAAVRLERDLLARLPEFSPSALLLVDAQGRVLLANQRWRDWFGLATLPQDHATLGAALAAGVGEGDGLLPWLADTLVRHESAGVWQGHNRAGLAIELHGRRFELGDGSVGCLLRATDVGAQGEIAMLRHEAAAARGADQAKTDFLSRASHELRTPLNAVLGFAQLLEHSATLADNRDRAFLGHIVQGGRHLQALIDDLLQLSGIESGYINIRQERVELSSLVDSALPIVQALADEHSVQLVWQPQHLVWAEADTTRMLQVLLNLLSNAIKYNRRGGRVTVTLGDALQQPSLTIADNGLGMNAHQLAHLFEPFNRLGAERSRIQGTGLGMAITRQLVQRMGGRLEVHSETDVGTSVRITCNVCLPQGPRLTLVPVSAAPATTVGAAGPLKSTTP